MAILKKFFGDQNKKEIDKLNPILENVNDLEKDFEKLKDQELKEETEKLKEDLSVRLSGVEEGEIYSKKEKEVLDKALPASFALVREASKRTLKLRHFDVQILGGIVLHRGKIAEMKTGEGKTLVSTLPIFLNALCGKGVHVVTVNDYLAKRDAGWMGDIYDFLGLSVGCIVHNKSYIYDKSYKDDDVFDERLEHLKECTRKEAYNADITYGTNNEFGFDYLRDNMVQNVGQMVQRGHHFAIVDEVDSILVDEARTPLIISSPAGESTDKYYEFAKLVTKLNKGKDYEIDEKMNATLLTSEGIKKLEGLLGVQNIYEEKGIDTVHHIEQSLKAHALFKKDKDYVVKDGEVIIVDEFTGRMMPGRRYSEGLHQAIEAKEGVEIKKESLTMATISFQNYFRMYEKLAGMTGTAETEAEEFHKIYKLEVVVMPTNRVLVRKDMNDLIYKSEISKFKAVAEDIKEKSKEGQPVLVGTVSIEKNELLSSLLKKEGVKHEVLNAKNHEKEATIISEAGEKGAVTVATNMAGRGTDIVLGDGVKELGGLHVIGTERHEARRIDNQLRGRSGRQGDPGSTQFYVSTEDDLMRIFGSDRVGALMERLGLPEDRPIEHSLISKSLESAQKKVEGNNFDIRKHLVEYDDIMNKQRELIYKKRKKILLSEQEDQEYTKREIKKMLDKEIDYMIDSHVSASTEEVEMKDVLHNLNAITLLSEKDKKELEGLEVKDLREKAKEIVNKAYETKEKTTGSDLMRILERAALLRTSDMLWVDHLDAMGHLREGIGLRGYGQKDPLVEYKNESYDMFQKLLLAIRQELVYTIFKLNIQKNEPKVEEKQVELKPPVTNQKSETAEKSKEKPKPVENTKGKVGRNDPCPCGSGKKYKKCCGK